MKQLALMMAIAAAGILTIRAAGDSGKAPPCGVTLSVIEERAEPVIKQGDPGTEGNRGGMEGGRVMKLDGVYHLFTAELVAGGWIKMKLGHWTSPDGVKWTRRDTMYESSGEETGKDPRASFWSPMPVYDEDEKLWNFFYVAYRAPVGPLSWNGRVWRAVSEVPGPEGIGGPWKDVGVVLELGEASDPWEGSQGTDSFFPYRVGEKWVGFYGSSNGADWWKVGLAGADTLAGPWRRLTALNPVTLGYEHGKAENPVVTHLKSGRYVAVFEVIETGYGYADSRDGLHWSEAKVLPLPVSAGKLDVLRTPLGLIAEPDGTFTTFHTGFPKGRGFNTLWKVRIRIDES